MKLEKFDYQIGNKRKKNTFIILGLVCLGAFVTVILYRTFASYNVTNSYNIIGGKVADFAIDGLTIYLVGEDGTETATSVIPKEDEYVYDTTRSKCQNGTEIVYDKEADSITIDETAGDTCSVYFNYIPLAKQTLYALGYTDNDIKEGRPYGVDGTNTTGFYAAEDDYGISYYYYTASGDLPPTIYAGSYGYFLIRINGNGSVRAIMDFKFNSNYNQVESHDKLYLGYMYNELGVENIESFQSSTIKKQVDEVYIMEALTTIDDSIFCNDRSLYNENYGAIEDGDSATKTGIDLTYYSAYYRLRNNTPTLKCNQKEDAFTVDESELGNGLLDYSVGLLSVDELYMTNFALFFQEWAIDFEYYLTMTPAMFKDGIAYVYAYKQGNLVTVSITEQVAYSSVVNFIPEFLSGGDGYYEIIQ